MSAVLSTLMVNTGSLFAAATKQQATSTWIMWALIAVMLVVFYFILIRPQRKRAQEHDQMVSKMEKGDEVVTIGGLHGTLKKIDDDTVVIEVDKGISLTFSRSAIARSLTVHEEEEEEEEEEELEEEEPEEEPTEDEAEEPTEEEEAEEVADESAEEPPGNNGKKGKK
jgi:preprotein translocase subunit YajC